MKAFERLREIALSPWQAPGTAAFAAASAGLVLLLVVVARSSDGWVPVLDSANLVFHEAGHPLFGLLGELPQVLGGTLMQLLVPTLALFAFWRQRQATSTFAAGVWFFENWLNVARYMADARAQVLPLVGGGEHDWTELLTRVGLLRFDTRLAGVLRVGACLGMLALWLWLAWLWRRRGPLPASGARPRPRR